MKRIVGKSNPKAIRLATFNLRVACDPPPNDWESRLPRILKLLSTQKFDIFGTQEGLKHQIEDVAAGTGFKYVGTGRDDFADKGEHCAIFYNPERISFIKGGTFALSETPDVAGSKSWDTCCSRIASWGFFRDRASGRDFCYYNTHLDHVSERARIEGIKMVVKHATENCAGLPLVLTGDFNAYPNSETYRYAAGCLDDAAVLSPVRHRNPSITWHGWGIEREGNDVIDFIFLSKGIRVLDYFIDDRKFDGEYASDHYAVVADLVF